LRILLQFQYTFIFWQTSFILGVAFVSSATNTSRLQRTNAHLHVQLFAAKPFTLATDIPNLVRVRAPFIRNKCLYRICTDATVCNLYYKYPNQTHRSW